MDFTLTPDQEALRKRVRAWLSANIPDDWKKFGLSEVPRPEAYDFLRKWQKALHDAGFIGLTSGGTSNIPFGARSSMRRNGCRLDQARPS